MAIEYKKQIVFTKDSTIYGHQSLNEGGFPKDAGNGKLSQVLDLAENQTVDSLKNKITITIDLDDSRLYHFNIDGVSVATFEIPADRFLKAVSYDDVTKVLTFTFFTGTGEESVSVDLSSLVDTYTAGNGLQLSGGVFSVKVKNTETRLKADSTGLYIDLSDITAKITAEETARKNADTALSGRIDDLTETVNGIETRVDAKVTKAETAATNASNSATSASASATTATEKATSATNSASRASTSEVNAKTYKEQAQSLLEQADLNLIESIEQTTTSTVSSGKNVITITQKDGTKSTFDVYNGAKGDKGDQGEQGPQGEKGDTGDTGPQGPKGDPASVPQASSSVAGIMKLFSSLGQNTDGAPTNKAVQDAISAISLKMYPVGSIYMSVDSASPASFLGGTWEVLRDRFLVGAGNAYAVNTTGGEANHTLTEAEMPSHNHKGLYWLEEKYPWGVNNHGDGFFRFNDSSWRAGSSESYFTVGVAGYSQPHNNLPPYLAVYMWKRTA